MTLDASLDGNKIVSRYAPVVFDVVEDPYFQVPQPRLYVYWPHEEWEALPWATHHHERGDRDQ